jgi:hypothetical protein
MPACPVRPKTCMKPSIIVWDLETVPDLAGFAAANDLVGKSDVEVREAIGDKFPKHMRGAIEGLSTEVVFTSRTAAAQTEIAAARD